mmetsp:Transcript_20901/g.30092  ORF Transcript_20901/g.30092 Transcript_20901/m.30092 type:complete len:833 (+) Transcript_20901:317-2815(+)|eukprot:CAMPEP_0185029010 /NCGR_PEP_ID=MMETSP1103-20130426/15095_1 /TAXON_ID=36769 /ORGANISM="Paraphysomonas bandaiensis, Strain Caron Lab Isolate" /LENGTH=832 /DNA_ID=CAMNT_0027563611 /DNA_START=220 /DNA_END=2718 /DNA_ORIENTATION=-
MWRPGHDEEFTSHAQRKGVKIYLNGEFESGKDLHIESDWTLRDFLNACAQRLGTSMSLKRVFNADGNDLDDCMMIEDNDILFLSNGDDFIPPRLDVGSVHMRSGPSWESIPSVISGFKIGDVLGRGGFGEVRIGEHHLTGERVALKFLRKAEIISMGAAERTTTEIQCLSALRHAHIIRLMQHLESPHHVVLVFEIMEGGDLAKYLLTRQEEAVKSGGLLSTFPYALPEDEARHVFSQIISAIGYAHNQHICHRDLKLENILLKHADLSCVKIADFGLSAFYRPGAMMKSSCGTLSFLAPEVFQGTSNAGPPLDVWALGVILFALLCGRLPFEGPDLAGTKRPRDTIIRSRISKGHYKIEEGLSPEAKDLVRRMLRVDPSIRASVPEIFSHVWMKSTTGATYDSSHSSSHRDLVSPLSVMQKLTVGAPSTLPAPISNVVDTPTPATGTYTQGSHGGGESLSSVGGKMVPSLLRAPPHPPRSEDEYDSFTGVLSGPSSNEMEHEDGLETLDMDRVVSRLANTSPISESVEVVHSHTPSRSRRASRTSQDEESESVTSSPKPSFVLVPLRRNPNNVAKDTLLSPRRPRTATGDITDSSDISNMEVKADSDIVTSVYRSGRHSNAGDSISGKLLSSRREGGGENGHSPHSTTNSPSHGTGKQRGFKKATSWNEYDNKDTMGDYSVVHTPRKTGGFIGESLEYNASFVSPRTNSSMGGRTKHSSLHIAGSASLKACTSASVPPRETGTHPPSHMTESPTTTRRKGALSSTAYGSRQVGALQSATVGPRTNVSNTPYSHHDPSYLASAGKRAGTSHKTNRRQSESPHIPGVNDDNVA